MSCYVSGLQLKKNVRPPAAFLAFFPDPPGLRGPALQGVDTVRATPWGNGPRNFMKENRSSRSLRQSQQREKGEPAEELRHLDKTQKFFPSFIDSFTHACMCSRVRRARWAPSVWCAPAPTSPPPPSRAELTERRGWDTLRLGRQGSFAPRGWGTTLEFTAGTGRQREQYACLKQNKHNLPFSAESEDHSESSGCAAECATVAGRPSLRARSVIRAFPWLLFSAPRSFLRSQ